MAKEINFGRSETISEVSRFEPFDKFFGPKTDDRTRLVKPSFALKTLRFSPQNLKVAVSRPYK